MTGLEQFVLALVLLGVFATVVILLIRRGTGGKVSLNFGKLFDAKVEIDSNEDAKHAIRKAAEERGTSDVSRADREIDEAHSVRLARVLWVDDYPDNNLYETIALEELGLLVTKATSAEAGLTYLRSSLDYALIISDVARHGNSNAGLELLKSVERLGLETPVIFYTSNAARHSGLIAQGARSVVDSPADLVAEILLSRPR
ncbi:MAG: hypothetical protein ACRDP6_39080 [Actinoallomurus sp.]